MKIIHIMQDGSVRESVNGHVIHNKEFYAVVREIMQAKKK